MALSRAGARLPVWAVAFIVGILLCDAAGPLAAVPALWAAAALTAAAIPLAPTRWLGCQMIVVVALLGGVRSAIDAGNEPAVVVAGAVLDDRVDDDVVGVVSGPVEDDRGRRRFVVTADAPSDARVIVTVRGGDALAVLPGDRVRIVGRLRKPRGYRVPGAVDAKRIAAARGGELVMSVDLDQVTIVETAAAYSVWRSAAAAQRTLSESIALRAGDTDGNAVVRAMVVGDRGALDNHIREHFRDAGVAHVLAVSGLHLAVIAMLVFVAVRRLWAAVPGLAARCDPIRAAAVCAAPAAVAYAMVTGARTSTMRALLVVLLVLAGALVHRRARVIDALGLAALVLVVIDPWTIYDPSFQLSFTATATLALALGRRRIAQPDESRARRALSWCTSMIRASVWASLATAPFTALSFGRVSTGGVVANLFVVPATELVIVPFGLLGAAVSRVSESAGGLLIDIAVVVAGVVADLAGAVAAHAPVIRVPAPRWWELCAALALWTAAICAARRAWRPGRSVAVAAVAAAFLAGSLFVTSVVQPRLRHDLRVTILDVGQGDAAVVELPGGEVWLIDGGGAPFGGGTSPEDRRRGEAPGEHSVLRFLDHRRIRHIDVAILSHPHPDHFLGLNAVARAIPIDELWVARPDPDRIGARDYQHLVDKMIERGTRVVHPRIGVARETAGVTLSVLYPRYDRGDGDRVATTDPVMTANDNSLVLQISFAGRRLLFPGDVELETEQELVDRYRDGELRADLIKVPHHGSNTSSTGPFVKAVAPHVAVISCGVANRFGFPAAPVVRRWQRAGAEVLRTDRQGAVTAVVSPDGVMSVTGFD